MDDLACVRFLQWALPILHLRWRGFRRVRRQVCRRITSRLGELDLAGFDSYREYLGHHPGEWNILDRLCRVTISRFYRDRIVLDYLGTDILPALIDHCREKNDPVIRVWSAGCASGEEPYTMSLLWHFRFRPHCPDMKLEIVATDTDPVLIDRARTACYSLHSLHELPAGWIDMAFDCKGELYCLHDELRQYVRLMLKDVRAEPPGMNFHLVFCRNLAFTYFDRELQEQVLHRISGAMDDHGILITGSHETDLPGDAGFVPVVPDMPIYRKT